MNREEAHCDVV
ncbi:hypothetical protein M1E08_04605 [Erwinia sp. PK3-005]|nr:hypothetical protein [Mixta sp.]UQY46206.1 hypothetical protein K6958_16045 [Mixta hanseatica]